jgi:meso-butanediol dehydrogenase/(S,S)-butanediol dehydrogenase/diacetyl reductase
MQRFTDKVALVSGGAGGIGGAVAARLEAEGATVVRLDLAAGDGLLAADVSEPEDCTRAVAAVVDAHGRLDVLVNAAGIGGFWPIAELPTSDFQRILAVNLTGAFLLSQAALPSLLATRGNIVNLASTAGLRATAFNAAYCASKGGLIMLTRSMAVELASSGVRVNAVCPSAVDTPMLRGLTLPEGAERLFARNAAPLGRVLEADEVATAVAYLASDEAAAVTGSTFVIDGGATA